MRCSPLSPSELNVLKAQYEKEGVNVGMQTKFNYAWVSSLCSISFESATLGFKSNRFLTGPSEIERPRRPAPWSHAPVRDLQNDPRTPQRMPLLPRARKLQVGQLRRGQAIQRPVTQQGANKHASVEPGATDR
jgi:hypothetical protein